MNIKDIKKLVDLVETAQVSRLSVETAEMKIEVRKELYTAAPMVDYRPQMMAQATVPVASTVSVEAAAPKDETAGLIPVKSEMVGTFYLTPNPDADPYVKTGDRIEKGQVICIIEAMKLFNEIESDVSGTIEKICVAHGESVEFGQPMFLVRP